MGVRVYIPSLGRFLSVDPVEGGTDNNYAYANDPVNEFDLGGNIVETIADIAGIGYDSYQLYKKPSWGNAGMLAWSVAAAFVPFVPGSYAGRIGAAALKASKGAAPAMTKKAVTKQTTKTLPIKGYTRHGLNQAISRNNHGVSVRAINSAVRKPLTITKQSGGRTKYNGRDAVVVVNNKGKVITTWAKNKKGRRY